MSRVDSIKACIKWQQLQSSAANLDCWILGVASSRLWNYYARCSVSSRSVKNVGV